MADIFRARARTFWFAARFLPADRRPAVAGLYTFARTIDDLVDEPPPTCSPDEVRAVLAAWRCWVGRPDPLQAPDHAVGVAVARVLVHHGVPSAYLQMLIDGVTSDLSPRDVGSWTELRTYCIQVASSVGLAMCHLLGGGDDPLARQAAVELGIAMQLTNILRDIPADLRVGRVYLPSEDLATHGYSRERLAWLAARVRTHGPGAIDEDFRDLMRGQLARARDLYTRGVDGVRRLPPEARLGILLAGRLYQAILDTIESADYDVFSRRAATSLWLKLAEAARWSIALRLPEQFLPRPTYAPTLGGLTDAPFTAWSAELYDSANDLAVVTQ